jgi:hypothetical protein
MNIVFNVAKGRLAYYHDSARTQPNAGLVVVALRAAGLASDEALMDRASLGDILSISPEVTNPGYSRKILSGSAVPLSTIDNANDRVAVDLPDLLWTAVQAGDAWAKLLVCFDADTTTGTDFDIVPLTAHDISFTPDGSNILVVISDYARMT